MGQKIDKTDKIAMRQFGEIALRLRALRHAVDPDISQDEYAKQANVPPKSYNQWESGAFRISVDGAIRLCERYGVSLDFIYFGSLDTLPHRIAKDLASSPLVKNSNTSKDKGVS